VNGVSGSPQTYTLHNPLRLMRTLAVLSGCIVALAGLLFYLIAVDGMAGLVIVVVMAIVAVAVSVMLWRRYDRLPPPLSADVAALRLQLPGRYGVAEMPWETLREVRVIRRLSGHVVTAAPADAATVLASQPDLVRARLAQVWKHKGRITVAVGHPRTSTDTIVKALATLASERCAVTGGNQRR
jgi:hypothetical protein